MQTILPSPIGDLHLTADDAGALTALTLDPDVGGTTDDEPRLMAHDAGALTALTLDPDVGGTTDDEPRLAADDAGALTALTLDSDVGGTTDDEPRLTAAADQLRAYFAGERATFDLVLRPRGSAFEQRVWAELQRIPYGETASYAEIARRLGLPPTAARAVGRANGRNPIAIVVPCHRVVGSDGSLTGYAYGLDRKRALLALEAAHAGTERSGLDRIVS